MSRYLHIAPQVTYPVGTSRAGITLLACVKVVIQHLEKMREMHETQIQRRTNWITDFS